MPDTFYIALAYGLTIVVIVGYLIYASRRIEAAETRLAAVAGATESASAGGAGEPSVEGPAAADDPDGGVGERPSEIGGGGWTP